MQYAEFIKVHNTSGIQIVEKSSVFAYEVEDICILHHKGQSYLETRLKMEQSFTFAELKKMPFAIKLSAIQTDTHKCSNINVDF